MIPYRTSVWMGQVNTTRKNTYSYGGKHQTDCCYFCKSKQFGNDAYRQVRKCVCVCAYLKKGSLAHRSHPIADEFEDVLSLLWLLFRRVFYSGLSFVCELSAQIQTNDDPDCNDNDSDKNTKLKHNTKIIAKN